MKEYALKSEIAQLELSDLGCGSIPTPRRKIPFFDIRFSTDREPVRLTRLYAQRRGWAATPR